jgi:RimJ/RimL family protein N-acetyltransferase
MFGGKLALILTLKLIRAIMHLQTDRLILRPFEAGDLKPFSHINADPEVMRFFPAPQTSEETAQMLARWADKQTRYGYGFAAVETRHDKQLIGMAGLSRLEDGVPIAPCSEIGWRLTPSAWHKGYATEAARAWLAYGFDTLGLSEIFSYTPRLNLASQRVMQRIGMQHAQALDFEYPALPEGHALRPMVVYRLPSQTYVARS